MMFSYPYFNFPYYRRPSRYGYHYPNTSSTVFSTNSSPNKKDTPKAKKEENTSINEDPPIFQFFGINFYFDDILLICLIFFLYKEDVKDESLFIALILLLLS